MRRFFQSFPWPNRTMPPLLYWQLNFWMLATLSTLLQLGTHYLGYAKAQDAFFYAACAANTVSLTLSLFFRRQLRKRKQAMETLMTRTQARLDQIRAEGGTFWEVQAKVQHLQEEANAELEELQQ